MDLIEAGANAYPDLWTQIPDERLDALTLLAAVHEGRDKDVWSGLRYWDQLTERTQLSRIAGPDLKDWWERITSDMGVTLWPSNRAEVLTIIQAGNPEVLNELVASTQLLISLLRLAADTKRSQPADVTAGLWGDQELPL